MPSILNQLLGNAFLTAGTNSWTGVNTFATPTHFQNQVFIDIPGGVVGGNLYVTDGVNILEMCDGTRAIRVSGIPALGGGYAELVNASAIYYATDSFSSITLCDANAAAHFISIPFNTFDCILCTPDFALDITEKTPGHVLVGEVRLLDNVTQQGFYVKYGDYTVIIGDSITNIAASFENAATGDQVTLADAINAITVIQGKVVFPQYSQAGDPGLPDGAIAAWEDTNTSLFYFGTAFGGTVVKVQLT